MSKLKIDVERKAEEAGRALRKGLREGLNESGQWLLDKGQERAENHIFEAGRIWRQKLKNSFRKEKDQFSRYYRWKGELSNYADHAEINENGLPPGSNPPVQALLPWIDSKVIPNTTAQARAERSDVSDWHPDLQAAAEKYGTAEVITAFAIKESLESEGYEGIAFMERTESYLNQVGPRLVKQKVEKHMNRELRKRGLQ